MTLQNVIKKQYNDALFDSLIKCAELLGYKHYVEEVDESSAVEQLYTVFREGLWFCIYLWEYVEIDGKSSGNGDQRAWSPMNLTFVFNELETFLSEAYGATALVEKNPGGHNVAEIDCDGQRWSITAPRDDVYTMFFELFTTFMRYQNAKEKEIT